MKSRITIIFLLIVAFNFQSCNKAKERISELHGLITFTAGDVKVNDKKGVSGSEIVKGDVISTGSKSIVVIQFSQSAVVTLKSDTVLKIDEAVSIALNGNENDRVGLAVDKGTAFNKVVKKGTEYSVSTSTMVAAVRGTVFQVSEDKGTTRVDLAEGVLGVTQLTGAGKGKEVILQAGEYIISTKDGLSDPAAINDMTKDDMNVYNRIGMVDDTSGDLSLQDKVAEDLDFSSGEAKIKPDAKSEDKSGSRTAPEKKDEGIISLIKMKDGSEYTGTFSQKGEIVEIIMADRRIKVKASEIQEITRYKNK